MSVLMDATFSNNSPLINKLLYLWLFENGYNETLERDIRYNFMVPSINSVTLFTAI